MIDNIAFVGENLKKGLEKLGHTVILDTDLHWTQLFRKKYGKQHFDIVHIHSPNFKKLTIVWRYLKNAKLICHWHGSDLRFPYKAFPVYHYLKRCTDFNLYSTLDLAWWLRKVLQNKKQLFNCPIDTDAFKPNETIRKVATPYFESKQETDFTGGGASFKVHRIPHNKMPEYLNRFKIVNVHNKVGDNEVDDGILSVVAMEAVCCGCIVPQLPWLDRDWVLMNAELNMQSKKLEDIYKELKKK